MRRQESQGVLDSYYSLSIKQDGQVLCASILGEVNPQVSQTGTDRLR